jgi:hypothetical protein
MEEEDSLNLFAAALRKRLPLDEEGVIGEDSSMEGGARSIRERDEPSLRTRRRHSGSSHFHTAERLILDLRSGEGR